MPTINKQLEKNLKEINQMLARTSDSQVRATLLNAKATTLDALSKQADESPPTMRLPSIPPLKAKDRDNIDSIIPGLQKRMNKCQRIRGQRARRMTVDELSKEGEHDREV